MENKTKVDPYLAAGMDEKQKKKFLNWQTRTIVCTMITYAIFYFVRKNLSFAMPGMFVDLGMTKADMGLILSMHGVVYGISRFVNGMLGDRVNSRNFMALGLFLCSLCNIFFGFSSALVLFGVTWILNGWFQGMGFPPCVRLLTHWIPPQELATKMSVWNTSHSIGAMLAAVVCGFIGQHFGWRWCFWIPSIIALLAVVFLMLTVKDTPSSVGLPELDAKEKKTVIKNSAELNAFIKKQVFQNKYIWILATANFFVYIIRFAVLDWGPTILKELRGMDLSHSGLIVACFEVAGILGTIFAGYITDKLFKGRGLRVCLIFMTLASLFLFMFSRMYMDSIYLVVPILMAAGFCIYGPQALVGISASNLATKRAASTAAGLTGIFGYASTIISGVGIGLVVDHYGWDVALGALVALGSIGIFVFLLGWNAPASGYEDLAKENAELAKLAEEAEE